MAWNFNVGDSVMVADENGQTWQGKVRSASDDVVSIEYDDGTEEVFSQDSIDLSKLSET